jgi:hypothetical protein
VKIIFYIIIAAAILSVTFFGLGPVLLADGSKTERIITLTVVLVLYVVLGWIAVRIKRHVK